VPSGSRVTVSSTIMMMTEPFEYTIVINERGSTYGTGLGKKTIEEVVYNAAHQLTELI
jgi:hypothetical protein